MSPQAPRQLELAPGLALDAGLLHWRFDRSSGPGGQNVNKLNTKATLTVALADLANLLPAPALQRLQKLAGHRATADALVISSEQSRSQVSNKRDCLEKLRELVVQALVRPKPRRKTKPSRGAVERRLETKTHRAKVKRMRRANDD